ncbi:MAG: anti-sigma factor antagonist [Bacteroidetes bacterium]|nr:anti-sigma factor antagonist [Bacteroidota bacterium]
MTQLVKIQNEAGYSSIHFDGIKSLDVNNAQRVKAEIKGLIDSNIQNLAIDLSQVHFIDSTGFGTLISILKEMKARNGRLILCGISNEVRELMDLMQLLNVFETCSSLQEVAHLIK